MFLPILGLVGIVLFGTTRAGQPDPAEIVSMAPAPATHDASPAAGSSVPAPPPPPAPRLRSVVEAEEQAAALADTVAGDTARAARPGTGAGAETP